ncbi:FeS assembly protein [Spiroplasma helicoides]|uniref:FeS assembly protein n=1 Tax=Spiroplasma helicoides TaxID=216938 RepID=A0A1B3SL70_9MOLU|nr:iron-sulfur cluster assembly scaffold protein [Spiroplasma helicoides]AOG60691.1 FeS assembly protein [Spiroplasma helicoides]
MLDKKDKIMLRQIIMEHYTEPENKGILTDAKNSFIKFQDSQSCADAIDVQIIYEDSKIVDARFDGVSCSISGAAVDILCSLVKNKTKQEALKYLNNYHNMITGKEYDEESLGELIVFWEIHHQGNRINCALLGADGIRSILENEVK